MDPADLERAIAPLLDELITPALVIDLDAVEHNLRATIERVGGPDRWRPHVKTVKQAVIVSAMLDAGLRCFKVATCDELGLVLDGAGELAVDVLLAYPLQRAALRAAVALADAHPHATLTLLADSPEHLGLLAAWLTELGERPAMPVLLDVDLGMQRTGAPVERWLELETMPTALRLAGLHGYDGHLRWTEREAAHRGYDQLCALATELAARFEAPIDELELLTSGTHGYAHALAHAGLRSGAWTHRVSPGTVVLSDRRSHEAAADIGLRQAAFVASRVISRGPDRLTLDAGSKGISPDVEPPNCAVLDHPQIVPGRPSEEHLPCRIEAPSRVPELGQLLWLVPEHVCTTVNLYREAVWIRAGEFAGIGPIAAAGHRPRAPGINAAAPV